MSRITLAEVIFELLPDPAPPNPRAMATLGTLVCWHPRYTLGDAHAFPTPQACAVAMHAGRAIALPVYLFDHSGLSISTRCAHMRAADPAGWDWGQVGVIYVLHEEARRALGVARLTLQRRAQIVACLHAEVATYDQYLRGDVYGYTLRHHSTEEIIDACWGFFGDNPHRNGMAAYLPEAYRAAILAYFHPDAA